MSKKLKKFYKNNKKILYHLDKAIKLIDGAKKDNDNNDDLKPVSISIDLQIRSLKLIILHEQKQKCLLLMK
jgi:hypothetical protein